MILRIVIALVLIGVGVAYAWLNGWLSRRDEREEAQHAGQVSWAASNPSTP